METIIILLAKTENNIFSGILKIHLQISQQLYNFPKVESEL